MVNEILNKIDREYRDGKITKKYRVIKHLNNSQSLQNDFQANEYESKNYAHAITAAEAKKLGDEVYVIFTIIKRIK